jgi:DNA-binding transcriptional MerR regulator
VSATETARDRRTLTIGAVRARLQDDFPDISISKIRYLEDRGLLTPRRTQGGYRVYTEDDVERLRRILELQRDQFLPLSVIRQELAAPAGGRRRRRRPVGLEGAEEELSHDEFCERSGIASDLAQELEAFGLLDPHLENGEKRYAESDVEIALACGRLARYGISPRHLRTFRTTADREAGLLEALVAPALRSRNPERRQEGIRELQELAELAQDLSQRLFWRDLRQLAGR